MFNARKPIAMLVLLRTYIKLRLFKKVILRGVDIVTNYSCNLSCSHCNISSMEKAGRQVLSLKDYSDIEKQCSRLGVCQYCFTGGEPLLRKDFHKIIKAFKPYKRTILIQTNGQLIDSLARAKALRKVGVDIVNLSLDSGIAKEHDQSRGLSGHFAKTQEVIKLCKQAKLRVIIGTVVSHQNLYSKGMRALFEFAKNNRIILLLNLAAPTGRWHNNKEVLLTKSDQLYVREIVNDNEYLRLDMNSSVHQYGCPAFKEKLYITPYGDVTGCTFVPISFGNLANKSIKQIRQEALNTDLMNKYSSICYAAEDINFINRYMSQLGEDTPKYYEDVMNVVNDNCPVCDSRKNKLVLSQGYDYEYRVKGDINLFGCLECGLIRLLPRPSLEALKG
ncbi:MAG: radical SAM protein, partial [Candidatus Omnitrophica bacterium]|nr:radical SAM protein [Candidatus Omnitrophota bacterium]